MYMYKLSDFKVGQTAYIQLTGNAKKYVEYVDRLIQECVVESVGEKYVVANGIKK